MSFTGPQGTSQPHQVHIQDSPAVCTNNCKTKGPENRAIDPSLPVFWLWCSAEQVKGWRRPDLPDSCLHSLCCPPLPTCLIHKMQGSSDCLQPPLIWGLFQASPCQLLYVAMRAPHHSSVTRKGPLNFPAISHTTQMILCWDSLQVG